MKNTRTIFMVIILFAIGTTSCLHRPRHNSTPYNAELAINEAIQTYRGCLIEKADSYSSGNGLPADIATAALADCNAYLNDYENIVLSHWRSIGDVNAFRHAQKLTEELKEQARGVVIGHVLRARSNAGSQ